MSYKKKYEEWLNSSIIDEATKLELKALEGNEKEIEERFYKDLEFGTGGLRGVLGAGTNRMNIYTVSKATQGLANYILKQGQESAKKGVAIAFDSRRMSPEFADISARVLAANGIKAFVFESLRPVPLLSFALRQKGCIAGIVITASHNPPEYNGYKAYWEDGAQVAYPRDEEIIVEVNAVEDFSQVKSLDKQAAQEAGLYEIMGAEIDDLYIEELKKLVLNNDTIKKEADDFTIVYTPLHGSGNIPVRRILKEIGFNKVEVVKEQELPDGNFPTVSYPNPEDIKAFALALELGKEKNADIIMATDPDADRLGILVKNQAGEYIPLTGNMMGILLTEYILNNKKAQGILPKNGIVIETIVSTKMVEAIARHYDVAVVETLTGFKFIGEKIKEYEKTGEYEYLYGFEESYGCLIGTHARDKDAIAATMMSCEMAAWYKEKGMTLYQGLMSLYDKYGYFKEDLESLTLKGLDGIEKINKILRELRNNPPKAFNDIAVIEARDYQNDTIIDLKTGATKKTGLISSNVLYYVLEDETWVCIRPSGTEPKVKFYFGVKGSSMENAEAKMQLVKKAMMDLVDKILA